jgi:hypothetical protein
MYCRSSVFPAASRASIQHKFLQHLLPCPVLSFSLGNLEKMFFFVKPRGDERAKARACDGEDSHMILI